MTKQLHLGPRTETRGGRWARISAALVDALVLAPMTLTLGRVDGVAVGAVSVLLVAAYEIGCNGRWGMTLGKRALGLRIVRFVDGGAISYETAAIRYAPIFALVGLGRLFAGLGVVAGVGLLAIYVPILFRADGRGLHDDLAGTVVVAKLTR